MTSPTDPRIASIPSLSFEKAMESLEAIIRTMDEGELKLDDTIADYEYATALRQHCTRLLREAKLKVDSIVATGDGAVLEPWRETADAERAD